MDDDPALRLLEEELTRDDPRLAALLTGTDVPRRHGGRRSLTVLLLLTAGLLTVALVVPPTVALGILAMLLAVSSPLVVCWFCTAGDRPAPRLR